MKPSGPLDPVQCYLEYISLISANKPECFWKIIRFHQSQFEKNLLRDHWWHMVHYMVTDLIWFCDANIISFTAMRFQTSPTKYFRFNRWTQKRAGRRSVTLPVCCSGWNLFVTRRTSQIDTFVTSSGIVTLFIRWTCMVTRFAFVNI